MSKQDADIFEVLIGKVGKCVNSDAVLGEALRVLGHAELFEPVSNVLHRRPPGVFKLHPFWTSRITIYYARLLIAAPMSHAPMPTHPLRERRNPCQDVPHRGQRDEQRLTAKKPQTTLFDR
jgi:hypothetical protein